ncbi:MAG: hypothetical protein ABFS38_17085 [Bacteroidota bacterium]
MITRSFSFVSEGFSIAKRDLYDIERERTVRSIEKDFILISAITLNPNAMSYKI